MVLLYLTIFMFNFSLRSVIIECLDTLYKVTNEHLRVDVSIIQLRVRGIIPVKAEEKVKEVFSPNGSYQGADD